MLTRRTFVGAAIAAVAGLLTFGLAAPKAARPGRTGKVNGNPLRETVKVEGLIPERLRKFNWLDWVRFSDGSMTVNAYRPPSDLDYWKLGDDLRRVRYVQDSNGRCCLLTPKDHGIVPGAGNIYWKVQLTAA